MKVSYVVIVLLLSEITLISGDDFSAIFLFGSTAAAGFGVMLYVVSQYADIELTFDPKREEPILYPDLQCLEMYSFLLFTTHISQHLSFLRT